MLIYYNRTTFHQSFVTKLVMIVILTLTVDFFGILDIENWTMSWCVWGEIRSFSFLVLFLLLPAVVQALTTPIQSLLLILVMWFNWGLSITSWCVNLVWTYNYRHLVEMIQFKAPLLQLREETVDGFTRSVKCEYWSRPGKADFL